MSFPPRMEDTAIRHADVDLQGRPFCVKLICLTRLLITVLTISHMHAVSILSGFF